MNRKKSVWIAARYFAVFLIGTALGVAGAEWVRGELNEILFLGYLGEGVEASEQGDHLKALENLYYAKWLDPVDLEPDVLLVDVYEQLDSAEVAAKQRALTTARIHDKLDSGMDNPWLEKMSKRFPQEDASPQ